MSAATTRTVDGRGRLSLGPAFAGRLVLITELPNGSIEITPAEAVPAREAWLHKNRSALKSVVAGIEQARAGQFAEAPDLDADAELAGGE
jgi:hypothetical protein